MVWKYVVFACVILTCLVQPFVSLSIIIGFTLLRKTTLTLFSAIVFFYDVSFAPSPTVFLMNVTSFHNVSFKLFEDNFSSSQRLGIQQLITHRRINNMTYQFCSIARWTWCYIKILAWRLERTRRSGLAIVELIWYIYCQRIAWSP